MAQKAIISLLVITIVGAVGVGVYDANRQSAPQETALAYDAEILDTLDIAYTVEEEVPENEPIQNIVADTEDNPATDTTIDAIAPLQQAVENVGETWSATGTITALDDVGITVKLDEGGDPVFVELGPSSFWQAQDEPLLVGERVTVEGFRNGEQIHARTLTTAAGAEIAFRNETGQPLWSGGANGGNANGQRGANAGAQLGEPQVAPEDWVTLTGTITASSNGNVTMQLPDGGDLQLQLGQPRFWQGQGVTLSVGNEIDVLGYWQADHFQVGEITVLATGERIMLRDPNGRPLWAGPGNSNGNGGNGNGGSGGNGNQNRYGQQ